MYPMECLKELCRSTKVCLLFIGKGLSDLIGQWNGAEQVFLFSVERLSIPCTLSNISNIFICC